MLLSTLLCPLLVGCASATILERLGFGMVEKSRLLQRNPELLRRHNSGNATCTLSLTTDIWATCAGLISQFAISLDYFVAENPGLGADCSNFIPGSMYCIYSTNGSPTPVSTRGTCGSRQNWTSTCIGSQWGDCCGIGGYCGTGEDYCGPGNCQEGTCDGAPIPYSTNGLCGSQNKFVVCPPKFGACCSQFGFCGNGSDFCGSGCQSGTCDSSSSSTTTSSTAPTQTPGSVSTDGTCGFGHGLVCTGSSFGVCCSAAGYCGSTKYECLDILGCQSAYGSCNMTGYLNATSTATSSKTITSVPASSTLASTKSSTASASSTVPSPLMPSTVSDCDSYHLVQSGDGCYSIEQAAGISRDEFLKWNPHVDEACDNLFLGYYVCTGVSH